MSGTPAHQNCSTCPHIGKCWSTTTNGGKKVSDQNVAINILICRLKLRIDPDYTVRNLLGILKPGMVRLVSSAINRSRAGSIDFDTMMSDIQSYAIECLMYDYDIGDFLVATAYLFHPTKGYLVRWARWYVARDQRFTRHHELHDAFYKEESSYNDDGEEQIAVSGLAASAAAEVQQEDPMVAAVRRIIDDGVSLNHREHRVITFCLQNGNESNKHRHIDGLHLKLAQLTGVSRPRITRLYRRAQEKIRHQLLQEC